MIKNINKTRQNERPGGETMTGKVALDIARKIVNEMKKMIEACNKDSCCNESGYLLTIYRVVDMLTRDPGTARMIVTLV